MSFSFLNAAALAMGALLLGPLLAHLARQRPVERLPYGAMMLVRRLTRRLRRRRRLRDPLLFSLRLLVLLALVLAAARPQLQVEGDTPDIGGSGRVVLVIDNSLSMSMDDPGGSALPQNEGAGTLLAQARDEALSLLDALPSEVLVGAVLTTSGGPVSGVRSGASRLTPELLSDHRQLARLIESIEPTWEGTDLAGALRQSRALLAGAPGEVAVFSDEAGPGVVDATVAELERLLALGGGVIPHLVRFDPSRNLAIAQARYGDGVEGGSVRVTVLNYGPDEVEATLTVTLPDDSEMTAFVEVPAAARVDGAPGAPGSAEELFTVPREVPGGVASVSILGDQLTRDDERFFHLPRVGASRVLVVDGAPGPTPVRSEVYFLERALAPWGGLRTGVTPDVTALGGVSGLDPERHRVVFLANVADPGPVADQLSAFVRAGGGLVISCGENVTPQRYNATLATLLPAPLRKVRNLVALDASGGVAFKAPAPDSGIFKLFSSSGRAGFSDAYLRRAVTFEPFADNEEVRTLLQLANGLPVLVERKVGRGRVLVFAGTVDLAWGNLPLQAIFLPFVQRIVAYLGGDAGAGAARFDGVVGHVAVVPLPDSRLGPVVMGPEGEAVPATVSAGAVRFVPRRPGAFSLELPGAPPLALVAVNTPAEESDVRRHASLAQAEADLAPSLFVKTVGFGRWLVGLGVLALVAQAVLARGGGHG